MIHDIFDLLIFHPQKNSEIIFKNIIFDFKVYFYMKNHIEQFEFTAYTLIIEI